MGFESPVMLWWLLAAAGPILLHMVAFFRLPVRRFGAARLLRQAVGLHRGRIRLRNSLLLALRILVIACAVLAAARPYLSVAGAGRGKGAPITLVVVLDDSQSMRRRVGDRTLFDIARDQALREIDLLGPGDTAALVLAGRPVRTPVFEPVYDLQRIRKELGHVEPTFAGTELPRALETAGTILGHAPRSGRRLLLLSDQARHAWSKPALPWGPGEQVEVRGLQTPAGLSWENHAVNAIKVSRAADLGPLAVRIEAGLVHAGPAAQDRVACTLEIGGAVAATQKANLPADGAKTVVFEHVFDRPGTYEGTVRLPRDDLAEDDALSFLVSIGRTIDVLVIDGDPQPGSYRDEAFYLERALATSPDVSAAVVDPFQAEKAGLDGYDVAFLINPGAISEPLLRSLEAGLQSGMGLFVALGDKLRLHEPWLASLPARLKGPQDLSSSSTPAGLRTDATRIGPLAGVASAATGLEGVKVEKRFVADDLGKRGARTVLVYDDGLPALVEGTWHQGRVLLWTSTLDRDWTDLPIRPGFVMLIQESVRYLTPKRAFLEHRSALAGETVPLVAPATAAALVIRGPSGKSWTFERGSADGGAPLRFSDTAAPGAYRVLAERRDGHGLVELADQAFLVRPDPGEWNLEPLPLPVPETLLKLRDRAVSGGRTPLWPYLLVLLVLFLAAEALVAGSALSKRANGT